MGHVAGDGTKTLDAAAALCRRVVLRLRHGDPRHAEQEARVDAVVASLDAVAGEQTALGPLARRLVALAVAEDVDDAADDGGGIFARLGAQSGGSGRRTHFDAFAAARAGVEHLVSAGLQGRFEALGHDYKVTPARPGLKDPQRRCNKSP
jgi:hypothetical protein